MKTINSFVLLLILFIACERKYPTEPEVQFIKIHFHYGFENELNTFELTYQKDLVMDGTIKTSFWLNQKEQNKIVEKIQAINFFDFPDTIKYGESDSIRIYVSPNPGRQFIRIKYQQFDKTVNWFSPLPESNSCTPILKDLMTFIIQIIEVNPEFEKLPPVQGGYL
jgi:hypothetical protein